jgi:hypothetical protein
MKDFNYFLEAPEVNLGNQAMLKDLLDFHNLGNFSQFKAILDQVLGPLHEKTPFRDSNFYYGLIVAGILDVSETESSDRWASSNRSKIDIFSRKPKTIGMTTGWLEQHKKSLVPLVSDIYDNPILLGIPFSDASRKIGIPFPFGEHFWNLMMNERELLDRLVEEQKLNLAPERQVELYDLVNHRWVHTFISDILKPNLIRTRSDFGQMSSFIFFPNSSTSFKLLHPEWNHFVAAKMIGWNTSDFLNFDGTTLRVPRRFRIPTLIARYLFASAESLIIGTQLEFLNINTETLQELVSFVRGDSYV